MSKKVKASRYEQVHNQDTFGIIHWIILLIATGFILIAPYYTALFNGLAPNFEKPIYSSIAFISVGMIALSVLLFLRLKEPLHNWSLIVWLLPISYWISSMGAASSHNSNNMIYLHLMYAAFFVFGLLMSKYRLGLGTLQYAILISGYFIVLYGFMNIFGNHYYLDAVMLTDQGTRLASVFQYANAYAAYLMALLFCSIYVVTHNKKWYWIFLNAVMLIPIALSFWMTLSRGALVLLPVVLLLILPFFNVTKQILYILYTGLSFLISLVITAKFTDIASVVKQELTNHLQSTGVAELPPGSDYPSVTGWLLLIAISTVTAALVTVIQVYGAAILQRWLAKISNLRFSSLVLPVISVVLGSIGLFLLLGNSGITKILPENLQTRIENINFEQHSVLERETFYKDSIKLIKEYPLFGAGGGAWAAMYEQYQNNPYVSRQAHNFFLQYLAEVGIVGGGILLIIILSCLAIFIRDHLKHKRIEQKPAMIFYIVAISLLVHSTIDFEFSYAYLASLIFLSLGGLIPSVEQPGTSSAINHPRVRRFVRIAVPSIYAIVFTGVFFMTLQYSKGGGLYKEAISNVQQNTSLQAIMKPIDQALEIQPYHPDFLSLKISILQQTYQQKKDEQYYHNAGLLIEKLRAKEPHNRQGLDYQFNQQVMKQDLQAAATTVTEALEKFPWDITYHERLISVYFDLGNISREANQTSSKQEYWTKGLEAYHNVLNKIEYLGTLPEGQMSGRPFHITPTIALVIGKIHFMSEKYADATTILQQGINENLDVAQNREIVRWYLASLQKQQKTDANWYNNLIAKDPTEAQQISALVNANFHP